MSSLIYSKNKKNLVNKNKKYEKRKETVSL